MLLPSGNQITFGAKSADLKPRAVSQQHNEAYSRPPPQPPRPLPPPPPSQPPSKRDSAPSPTSETRRRLHSQTNARVAYDGDPHNFAADDGTDFTDRRDLYSADYYQYQKEGRPLAPSTECRCNSLYERNSMVV